MLKPGQVFNNRYKIISTLGAGGFGAVYKVWDDNLQRHCAIKENLQVSAESQKQFKREAIMLANLNHAHLVRVTDYFIISDQGQYLVMDFVDGNDLQIILTDNGGPLPTEQALVWIRQVCDALIYIHNQNPPIIHRDIKPANIRITEQGNAVLVDFGLAKEFDDGVKTALGARGLTPHFAAPEQYGMGGTDAQSDIYSLGVTLYCLLTYSIPPDSVEIMVGNADPPSPAKAIRGNISDSVSDALQRAMQIRRTERYKSVSDFKDALRTSTLTDLTPLTLSYESNAGLAIPIIHRNTTIPVERALVFSGNDVNLLIKGIKIFQGEHPLAIENKMVGIYVVKGIIEENQSLPNIEVRFSIDINGIINIKAVNTNTNQALESVIEKIQSALSQNDINNILADNGENNKFTLSNGMEFMRIPAGEFLMGSIDSIFDSEMPQHTVNIPYDYWMARFPITNELYYAYVSTKGINHPVFGWAHQTNHPVTKTDWNDAMKYCQWLNDLFSDELPSGLVLRLPTESEWEKAARGTDGRQYPWGNEFTENKCNSEEGFEFGVTPVDLYSPQGDSPYGCSDMVGNTDEWTHSMDKKYPYNDKDGRENGKAIVERIMRGGNYHFDEVGVRCASRSGVIPAGKSNYTSFRVVASTPIEDNKVVETPRPIQLAIPRTVTPISNKIVLSNKMEFIRVPAGKFLMGSIKGNILASDLECPQHSVDIPYDYWIARYPVTNELYNTYAQAQGINHPVSDWEKKKDHPVTDVNWVVAVAYCQWLNNLLKTELPSGLVLCLPTEAEWEKAARGIDGREYPWGNQFDKRKTNSSEDAKECTTPVGLYSPQGDSPYGCTDMAGNVYEWTFSTERAYPYSAKEEFKDESSAIERILRGGSYSDSGKWNHRCAYRRSSYSASEWSTYGFRIMASPVFQLE